MYFDVIFGLGIFLVLAFTIVSQIFLDSYRFPQKRIADQGTWKGKFISIIFLFKEVCGYLQKRRKDEPTRQQMGEFW